MAAHMLVNNMKNSFLLLCCHVSSIQDDDFTEESELKTTDGKTKDNGRELCCKIYWHKSKQVFSNYPLRMSVVYFLLQSSLSSTYLSTNEMLGELNTSKSTFL